MLTLIGSGFDGVQGIEFHLTSTGAGGGMMGGGMGSGMGQADANIKVSNLQVNGAGTQITASVQVTDAAAAGTRQIRLETTNGEVMGMIAGSRFTVTK
jgi:hypothetical protein